MYVDVVDHPGEREREEAEGLDERFACAAGVANAADGVLVALTVEALATEAWAVAGVHTPVQWLMWRAGLSRGTATRVLRVARRAGELPTTVRLLAEGRLSIDQATTVARFVPAEYETSVCELAVNATVPQIVAATRQYGFDLDRADREAAAGDDAPRRPPERSVTYGTDDGDQWSAQVRLPVDEGVVVQAALEAVRDRLHDAERAAAKDAAAAAGRTTRGTDVELGVARVVAADALVEMARMALSERELAGGDTAARAGVLVHLEAPGADAGAAARAEWRAALHQGPALPGPLRRLLLCDADVSVVWERDGVPVATCRSQRIVPLRLRRLVEHRDGGCVVPGCDSRTHLEVHHVVHWEDGGETVTGNLAGVCGRHHRLHHAGALGITGDADVGLTFTDRWGRVIPPIAAPRPPRATDLPVVAPYDGPTGERLERDAVLFTPTRSPGDPPT